MRIFFIFASLVCVSSCADFLRCYYTDFTRTPKTYEIIAEYYLNFKISALRESDSTIFDALMTVLETVPWISKNEEYKKLMVGLEERLQNNAIAIALKSRKGKLDKVEADSFLIKMKAVAEENDFRMNFGLDNIESSPRTIGLITSAIKSIAENRAESCKVSATLESYRGASPKMIDDPTAASLILYAEFAKYCKTDSHLRGPLAQILKILGTRANLTIPFIKFNRKLTETREYDQFISECYSKHRSNDRNVEVLAKNIIYGPITSSSTTTLFYMDLGSILEELAILDVDRNQLLRRVIGSDMRDVFVEIFRIYTSKAVKEFVKELERQERNKEEIMQILSFTPFSDINDLTWTPEAFEAQSRALDEYLLIDRDFVEESVRGIVARISFMVNYGNSRYDQKLLDAALVLIIKYFKVLPAIKVENFSTDILDSVLELFAHPLANIGVILGHITRTITRTIELPYAKVSATTMKHFGAYSRKAFGSEVAIEYINKFAICILFNCENDEKFERFKHFHQFFESECLGFEGIAQTAIMKAFSLCNKHLMQQLVDYSKEHKIISKTFSFAASRIIKKIQHHPN